LIENNYPGIDPIVVNAVTDKAKRLIRVLWLSKSDLADLQQKWIAHIIQTKEYKSEKHPEYYHHIRRILLDLYVNECRRLTAQKREPIGSFRTHLHFEPDGRVSTLSGTLSSKSYIEVTRGGRRSESEQIQDHMDLESFLRELPEELSTFACVLKSCSVEEVGGVLGLSRATAYRRMDELRVRAKHFFENK
jgi:hypothetical protein